MCMTISNQAICTGKTLNEEVQHEKNKKMTSHTQTHTKIYMRRNSKCTKHKTREIERTEQMASI